MVWQGHSRGKGRFRNCSKVDSERPNWNSGRLAAQRIAVSTKIQISVKQVAKQLGPITGQQSIDLWFTHTQTVPNTIGPDPYLFPRTDIELWRFTFRQQASLCLASH